MKPSDTHLIKLAIKCLSGQSQGLEFWQRHTAHELVNSSRLMFYTQFEKIKNHRFITTHISFMCLFLRGTHLVKAVLLQQPIQNQVNCSPEFTLSTWAYENLVFH